MPVATSSRRRRQNSEEIEEARNTQANGNNEDVSDEDRTRIVKKENKGKGKQKAVPIEKDDDEDDGDEDDEDDQIDVSNFRNQPLRQTDLLKLKGISDDWTSMKDKIGQRWDIYKDIAAAMAEAGEVDTSSSTDSKNLDRSMREFLDVSAEMTAHAAALDVLHQRVGRGEAIAEAQNEYAAILNEKMEAYAGKTTRQKYARDDKYIDFQTSIWEVQHPGEPMPPLTDFIPKEAGDDDDEDDELEIGGATQTFNCPLTLTSMVNPVTSRICGHSFSSDAIKEHCKANGNKPTKCPASGCNKQFRFADCVPDAALAKKIKAHNRRKAAAEESDDEEVVD